MCLETVYKGKKKKEELAKLPEMITCWKVVQRRGNRYGSKFVPEYNYNTGFSFLAGWNKTVPFYKSYYGYKIAFHAFRTKKSADDSRGYYLHIVKCKTKKEDIVAIGEQYGNLCLVTKRIWMPKPK